MLFTIDIMKKYGMKWRKLGAVTGGVLKYRDKERNYFYFYLNEDNTEFYMGFYTKELYEQGVHDITKGPHINEIVIKNPELPKLLVKADFYEVLYNRYMEIYGKFYDSYVSGDIYSGILTVGSRHYHYISTEGILGYDYYIEQIKKPEKPYRPLVNTRVKLPRLSFTGDYMDIL